MLCSELTCRDAVLHEALSLGASYTTAKVVSYALGFTYVTVCKSPLMKTTCYIVCVKPA